MIKEYFNIAIKNLKHRKLRSFLTLLGIVISITTIFVLISISLGLESAVEEQFRLLGTDKLFIQPQGQLGPPQGGAAVQLTEKDVDVVNKINGVRRTTFFTIGNAEIEFNDELRFYPVYGMPQEGMDLYAETSLVDLEEGKFLDKGDVGKILIGYDYKYRNVFNKPIEAGDKLIINGKEFKVSGIFEQIGNPQDDKNIILLLDDFRGLFDSGDRVDMVMVQIEQGEDINDVAERIEEKLRRFRNVEEKNQDFIILTPEDLLSSFGNVLNIVTAFLLGIAAISLLVGGLGIANTIYTSVLERTKEIGVMKAIGARNSEILKIFLIEASFLGFIGGSLGVIMGISVSKSIEYIATTQLGTNLLQAAIPPYLIIGCLSFAILSGAISGLWPAWKATQIRPVEALRYE